MTPSPAAPCLQAPVPARTRRRSAARHPGRRPRSARFSCSCTAHGMAAGAGGGCRTCAPAYQNGGTRPTPALGTDSRGIAIRCGVGSLTFADHDGGSAVSTPFSLRAELKGVEVAPGVTLRYWEAGAGRVLVMLPGLGHAASLYKYQLEGLCDEFRVIALDPRGHGESDKPERGYNYHTLAKDLDGFLRALELNDVTILGHSGGCKIILTYLELYGDSRLRAIVFSDDSPCHLRDGIFSADQALAAIDAFQGPDAIGFSKGFSDQFLTDDAEQSAKEAFYGEGLKLPRLYMAKLFRWAAFGDWWDAYALVKVPTLVIGGRVSKVPVKIAQRIHQAVPGSSFVVFEADEGGGHAMFWEGPQKYNDSLRTFMSSS